MAKRVEGVVSYEGVALEFLLEHPGGRFDLGQLKNKAVMLSLHLGLNFDEVYDDLLEALKEIPNDYQW